jgi:prepilin-type N-terminal cleavage/methylation domain-containing protein
MLVTKTKWLWRRAGFTLTEVMIGLAILGLVSTSSYYALGSANNAAAAARVRTGALTAAQDRIDFILCATPFCPQSGIYPASETLAAPRVESPAFDLEPGTYVQSNVPVYMDPANPSIVVYGQMTTTVTDTGIQVNGASINTYRAQVTVQYPFRNRNYTVTMDTLRASEQ